MKSYEILGINPYNVRGRFVIKANGYLDLEAKLSAWVNVTMIKALD